MKSFHPVFLFDMDGVLVEPRGYRLAIQATLRYFTDQMGFGDLYPGEDAIAGFESICMTSEWDITPILLASILDGAVNLAAERGQVLDLPSNLAQACAAICALNLPAPRVDAARLKDLLGPVFKPGTVYAEIALALNRPGGDTLPFPNLAGHPLLDHILGATRALDGGPVTPIFQHFTLGSDRFTRMFGGKASFETPSYLLEFDHLLIQAEPRDRVLAALRSGSLKAAAFTARPSTPTWLKNSQARSTYAYSPEAEMVLEASGLQEIALVGSGQVSWLASELGSHPDRFIKPSPVQALAAIGAAVTRDPLASLWAAERLDRAGEPGLFSGFPPLSIHVFEDSAGGIHSVSQAALALAGSGLDVRVNAWGITANPVKRQALLKAGARLAPDINAAIGLALELEEM